MHSLLGRDFADAVVRDRVRFASRRQPARATDSAGEIVPAAVKSVVRPTVDARSPEAEPVCV